MESPGKEEETATSTDVDLDFYETAIKSFKKQKLLPYSSLFRILSEVKGILGKEKTLLEISVSVEDKYTVCGDLHGQFYDLLNIFEINGNPSESNSYIFNGDFVDRGAFSLEVILTLFMLKILHPKNCFLVRGNHECFSLTKIYGFGDELKTKYESESEFLLSQFADVFNCLPLCLLLNQRVLILHGGLFRDDQVRLDDIRNLDRFREPPPDGLMCDILWSDPQTRDGRRNSRRGLGICFGPDVTADFLQLNDLEYIIRSHEVKPVGYEVEHDGKCITIFSAPNYCDIHANKGAIIVFDGEDKGKKAGERNKLIPRFISFPAVPHPNTDKRSVTDKLASLGLLPKN